MIHHIFIYTFIYLDVQRHPHTTVAFSVEVKDETGKKYYCQETDKEKDKVVCDWKGRQDRRGFMFGGRDSGGDKE